MFEGREREREGRREGEGEREGIYIERERGGGGRGMFNVLLVPRCPHKKSLSFLFPLFLSCTPHLQPTSSLLFFSDCGKTSRNAAQSGE